MPSSLRIFEIVLYSLVNFLPYFLLVLYLFKEDFRFSKSINLCLFVLLVGLEIFVCVWASLFSPGNASVSFLNTTAYALLLLFTIKAHPGKLLFILLIISNMANQVVFTAKCLEGFLFPQLALQDNRWSFSVCSCLVQLFFLPPFFWFLKTQFKDLISVSLQKKIWNYLWLIPGTFYLFWFYIAYFNSISGITLAVNPVYLTFAVLINCGALLIYYLIAQTIREFQNNYELRLQNNQLAIQNLQYENLKYRMDETRHARHDLRQHMSVLYSLCKSGDYEQLSDYLQRYLKSTSPDLSISYCEHFSLNALLVYYAQTAKDNRIDFSIDLSLPKELKIRDTDLCVLLGNLIENACHGCMTLPDGKRRIHLMASMPTQNSLVFTLDNTFEGQLPRKIDHQYFSSKHEGAGIGLDSAQNIINRYNGVLKTEIKDDMFCVSAVLNL